MKEHLTNANCWCKPLVRQACPECEHGEGLEGVEAVIQKARAVECWRCDDHGLVEPYDDDMPNIIVHRGDGERET